MTERTVILRFRPMDRLNSDRPKKIHSDEIFKFILNTEHRITQEISKGGWHDLSQCAIVLLDNKVNELLEL